MNCLNEKRLIKGSVVIITKNTTIGFKEGTKCEIVGWYKSSWYLGLMFVLKEINSSSSLLMEHSCDNFSLIK